MNQNTSKFKSIEPAMITVNPFTLMDKEWMLITAGNGDSHKSYNTMTAAWGGLGTMWHKPVVFCFVRPTRFTYQFMEANEHFTLSFFNDIYRNALNICGTESGRDGDKVKKAGLTPFVLEWHPDTVAFQEARMVMVCKKLYFQDLDTQNFIDPIIEKNYPQKDYHRMYIGEVIASFIKE